MSRARPANYTANVNRAKTKKWVEAKSYSYDGGDWGEVDDYDEYGGYDEPEPQPAPKPTGLRQRGQSATQVPQEAYDPRQDLYQSPIDSRQQYPSTSGPVPPQQQQHYQAPKFPDPQPQDQLASTRPKSFDRNDEQRMFSAGGPQRFGPSERQPEHASQRQDKPEHDIHPEQQFQAYPAEPYPAPGRPPFQVPGHASMEGQARPGERTDSPDRRFQKGSYTNQARQSSMGSRTQSMTSNNSGTDFHNRRDFSPSAMPPPLQTRGSPSPYSSDINSPSRPPRKSSLGQGGTSNQPFLNESSLVPNSIDQEEERASGRDRAGSGAGKPLPFVRPAEIYKRMQEEKEKERQSQDSSRPSMDAILGGSNERPNLGRSQDSESSPRLKPMLDPVKERKSEYGIEGVDLQDQETPGERQTTSSKTFEFPKRESKMGLHAPKSSLGPMLPDVSRVSGFGESFFGTSENSGGSFQDSMLNFAGPSPQPAPEPRQSEPEKSLQHQPSLGFTSAVHQAFDKAEDQIPPTPSSTQGSSVVRSTSGGTSTVSPIISRGPSTATENWNSRLPGIDHVSTPMIPEGPEGGISRPISSESQPTPTEIPRKMSSSQDDLPPETEDPPRSFIPGYRRSSDTPSPDNSPRRTPILETNRQLRQPQEIEIAAATPTDPSFSTGNNSQASEVFSEENLRGKQPTSEILSKIKTATPSAPAAPGMLVRHTESPISPITPSQDRLQNRTDSSSSNRVRNLADKFESSSRPGSAHSTTPRASVLGGNAQRKDDLLPPRPLADRMESFRPHLPGGWESSTSIAPAAPSNTRQAPEVQHQPGQSESFTVPASDIPGAGKSPSEGDGPSASNQQPSAVGQIKDASEEAFAAVAAAGSALAGAFGAVVGIEHHDISPGSATETPPNEAAVPTQGVLHPDASRPHTPPLSDDELSTAAPTPLPQRISKKSTAGSNEPEIFPSSAAHGDEEINTSLTDEAIPIKQTPPLPLLATDTKPHQYESDRLRKEIVRELTPMSASEPTTAETDFSNYQMTLSTTNGSVTHPGHESGVLPREYESYWNEAASDDEVDDLSRDPGPLDASTNPEHQRGAASIVKPLQPSQGHATAPPVSIPQEEPSRKTSPMLPHRFSWEQPLQSISPEAEPTREQPNAPSTNFLKSAVYPDGHFQSRHEPSEGDRTATLPTEPDRITDDDSSRMPEKSPLGSGINDLSDSGRGNVGNDVVRSYASGLELASGGANEQPTVSLEIERGQAANDFDQQSPMVPSGQRRELEPPRPEPHHQPSTDIPDQPPGLPPTPPPHNAQPKIPAFREILALKSPFDRIQAYNETREQFANLNTGLAHWLAATINDLPEHADLLANSGFPSTNLQGHRPSPSRSKLGSLLPTGGNSSQQPQSQQYLNPSTQPQAPIGNIHSSGIGGDSSPGSAPSGGPSGKLSSQQVQARGKDLLHTAGVFGGKANVAAKGLFSKGRSKLRAASGNEKAFPRQPSGAGLPSQGMHQPPPSVQALATDEAPVDFHAENGRALSQGASPEPQYAFQSLQSMSPRDTTSVESFSQSQLGDDERSEESEPTRHDQRPRISNRCSKHNSLTSKDNVPTPNWTHLEGSPPSFPQDTTIVDPHVGSPKERSTPQSPTGSSRTPTQATFADSIKPTALPTRPISVDNPISSRQILEGDGASHSGELDPGRQSSPQSRLSPEIPCDQTDRAATPRNHEASEKGIASPQKQPSGDSKTTIRKVNSDKDSRKSPGMVQSTTSLQDIDYDRLSRAPGRMNALAASEVKPIATNAQNAGATQSRSRISSLTRDSLGVPQQSEDHSLRGPSIDSLPSRIDLDRPPSPVSPYLSTAREASNRRGRAGPIHYGPEHDFVPDSGHERRSRSGSYSKARPSQDSQRGNVHDYLAFKSSGDRPPQTYPGRPSREHSPMLQQQAPEYQIEGARSPVEWPPESKSRSRRSSKSSAFFKSMALGSSPKTEEPLPSNTQNHEVTTSPKNPSTSEKRKSKRASIFRSLPGNSGSESASAQSKENANPNAPVSEPTQPVHSAHPPPPPQLEDDEFPSRGTSRTATSKLSRRLQRSSTPGNTEQSSGKKKRFSGLGSLFGRGSLKSQNSSTQVPVRPSNEISSTGPQKRDFYPTNPTLSRKEDWYTPPKDNYTPPPPGGYYAPRPPQAPKTPLPYDPALHRTEYNTTWDRNIPAYVQDSTLRQPLHQQMSPPGQTQSFASPQPSATFPLASSQEPTANVPQSSTARSSSRGPSAQRLANESKPLGSSWTRFSQHSRSKNRQEQSRPNSNTSQQNSSSQPSNYSSKPHTNASQEYYQSHHVPSRSNSPPPPPPPPKDDWNKPRHRESTSRASTPRHSKHVQSPPQTPPQSVSSQNRQSLPPLQTNLTTKRKSGMNSAKTLMPEEKRKSRQQEIENSTLTPQNPPTVGASVPPGRMERREDEPIVMSATSFPGQEWQPEYAHWNGD